MPFDIPALPPDPDLFPKGQRGSVTPPGGDPGGGGGNGVGHGPGGSAFLNPFARGVGGNYGANNFVGSMLRRRDNIPAMLQQGEFVVNAAAAQHPGIQELLAAINQLGGDSVQHFAAGGMVNHMGMGANQPMPYQPQPSMQPQMPAQPQMGFGMGGYGQRHGIGNMGGHMPMHTGFGMGAMQTGAGQTPLGIFQHGYAPQAPAQPQPQMNMGMANHFPGIGNMGIGAFGGLPVQHFAAGGAVDAPSGSGGDWNFTMPTAQPVLSYQDWLWQTYKAGKHNIGKKDFDAKYRPEYDQYVARQNANNAGADNPMLKAMYGMLSNYGQQGYFSPGGSQAMMNAVQANARQNADALTNRAMNAANVYGMDPSQAGSTRLQALMGTNKDVANTMNNATYGQLANQQQFGQNLFGNAMGFNQNLVSGANDYSNQSNLYGEQNAYQRQQQGSPWGQIAGNIVGTGIGAFLGGPAGASAGGSAGGAVGNKLDSIFKNG